MSTNPYTDENSLTDPLVDLESVYSGFSCPFEEFDESFAELVATEYAREVIKRFSGRYEPVLKQEGAGVDSLFYRLGEADLYFELSWSSEVGNLHSAISSQDKGQALKSAAAFAILASGHGLPGDWEIRLLKPSIFLWGDWLLPSCDRLAVTSTGAQATITSSLKGNTKHIIFTLDSHRQAWHCDTPDLVAQINRLKREAGYITLMTRPVAVDFGFLEESADFCETYSNSALEALSSAIDLIEEHSAPYYLWVMRMVRRLAVQDSNPDILNSGSHGKLYRTIYISNNPRPQAIGEMLVHESSHQYFDFIKRLGAIIDPSHKQLYYSPVKRCLRPLDRILLAYHAFANVMLFYRDLIDKGLDTDGAIGSLLPTLANDLHQLEQPLREADALTPIGRALVKPLMERGTW